MQSNRFWDVKACKGLVKEGVGHLRTCFTNVFKKKLEQTPPNSGKKCDADFLKLQPFFRKVLPSTRGGGLPLCRQRQKDVCANSMNRKNFLKTLAVLPVAGTAMKLSSLTNMIDGFRATNK